MLKNPDHLIFCSDDDSDDHSDDDADNADSVRVTRSRAPPREVNLPHQTHNNDRVTKMTTSPSFTLFLQKS